MELLIICWIIWPIWGYSVGKSKGRASDGVLLGLFLGLIGVVITYSLGPAGAVRDRQVHQSLVERHAAIVASQDHLARYGASMTPEARTTYAEQVNSAVAAYQRDLDLVGATRQTSNAYRGGRLPRRSVRRGTARRSTIG